MAEKKNEDFIEALARRDPALTLGAQEVAEWPQFMRGCIRYRQSLDEQAPNAQRSAKEFGNE